MIKPEKLKRQICIMTAGLLLLTGCGGNGSGTTPEAQKAETQDETVMPDGTQNESGGTVEANDPQGTDISAPIEAAPPLTDYVSDELMQRADMWSSCDDTALAAVMKKAAAGEQVTIACIGGSITQGTISSGTSDSEVGFKKCYADIFFEW